ncbi:hypothetical protein N0V95_008110 [Ascochyta clinopodiicola]|nr:hypothetical protein N0V95_008110 [Ascochyta clinopodiicola]
MATDSSLSLLFSMVSFFLKFIVLLCMFPLIGSGPLQAVMKTSFRTLSGSPGEFEYPYESDDGDYFDDSSSDDWEAYRCLFTRRFFKHLSHKSKPYDAAQSLPVTAHHRTHGPSSSPPPTVPRPEAQKPPILLAKPFSHNNFDPFYGRERPLRRLGPIFPLPATDRSTFLEKDTEQEGGNEYVEMYGSLRWQRIPQFETEDTSMVDAVAADTTQLVSQAEEDISMAGLSTISTPRSSEVSQDLLTAVSEPANIGEASKQHHSAFVHNDGSREQAPQTTQGTTIPPGLGSGADQGSLAIVSEPLGSDEAGNLPCRPIVYNDAPHQPTPHAAQNAHPFSSQHSEVPRDTWVAPVSSPEQQQLEGTFRSIDSNAEALSEAFNCLRKAVLAWDSDTYQGPADAIKAWLGMAEEKLAVFTPLDVHAQVLQYWSWIRTLSSFYNELQPHGYLFEEHGDDALLSLLKDVHLFGHHLGLQFQSPNFTRPGTPPAASQHRLGGYDSTTGVSSSAPIKPYDSPVEAPTQSLRYFELPIKEVHEMGQPSPKKPPPRASWLSLDRKPWWLRYPDAEEQRRSARTSRSKSMRSWFKSDKGANNAQEEVPSLPFVQMEVVRGGAGSVTEDKERSSDGSTLMDWSGLDYVRKIYVGRKSRVGL